MSALQGAWLASMAGLSPSTCKALPTFSSCWDCLHLHRQGSSGGRWTTAINKG